MLITTTNTTVFFMVKLISIYLTNTILFTIWVTTNIGNNLFIDFPSKATISNPWEDHSLYFSTTVNCDFFVDISQIPDILYPKNENEANILLDDQVERAKQKGGFISLEKFNLGQITGIKIKQYFIPVKAKKGVKMIEVVETFFYNKQKFSFTCQYKNRNTSICEKECNKFLSSLKNKGN